MSTHFDPPKYTCAPASSPEGSALLVADLSFDSKLDEGYELRVTSLDPSSPTSVTWISRSDARKIISHLQKVFNI